MYFAIGWPKTYQLPTSELILSIKYCPTFDFVAVVTPNIIFIWSGDQHRVLLGHFCQTSSTTDKLGQIKDLFWCDSRSTLAIGTTKGYLCIFRIDMDNVDLLDYRNLGPHGYISLGKKNKIHLVQLNELLVSSSGISWVGNLSENLYVVVSNDGCFRLFEGLTSKKPQLQEEVPIHVIKFSQHLGTMKDPQMVEMVTGLDVTIVHMTFSFQLQAFGIVFLDGRAGVVTMSGESLQTLKGALLPTQSKATCIHLNSKYNLAAVGCESGNVEIISLGPTPQLDRTFSLAPWGILMADTGPVSCLEWSPDSRVLAVGYLKRGFSMWSLYGCRLQCTLPQLELIKKHEFHKNSPMTALSEEEFTQKSNRNDERREPFREGVVTLSWGSCGYHMLTNERNRQGELMQFSFVKTCLATNPNLSYCLHILLQGEDRLLLLEKRGKTESEFKWKHLQLPFGYLKDNWPICLVSISRDGNFIAVAGKFGFTIYNLMTKKWILFGDQTEEKEIVCCGLCWYNHIVIVTNYNTSTSAYEVLFFPNTRLRKSNTLYKSGIPQNRKPLYLDCNDQYLVLFTTDSFCYQYKIIESGNLDSPVINLQLVQQVMLSSEAKMPVSILLLPSTTIVNQIDLSTESQLKPKKSRLKVKTLNLDASGLLSLSNAERTVNLRLADHVEQFWLANTEMEDLGNTMWAYGKGGLQVWFPFFSQDQEMTMDKLSAEPSFEFDPEVYPIGFIPEWAVIVGISQHVTYSASSNLPFFDIQAKTHPFLHSVLRHEMDNKHISQAIRLATKYSYVPHFAVSLELLLHETLESYYCDWKISEKSINTEKIKNSEKTINSEKPINTEKTEKSTSGKTKKTKTSEKPINTEKTEKSTSGETKKSKTSGKTKKTKTSENSDKIINSEDSGKSKTSEISEKAVSPEKTTNSEITEILKNSDKIIPKPISVLKKVVDFLKEFPVEYPSVVVRCARKTDPGYWSLLFEVADKPLELFQKAIANGEVSSAASYLRVILVLEGVKSSRRAALKVLELALEQDDMTLLQDLMRFLQPTEDSVSRKDPPVNSPKLEEITISDIGLDDEEYFMQEMLLSRYARKLLRNRQIRMFVKFGAIVDHELRGWLYRERSRDALLLEKDYPDILACLHEQFNLEYPLAFIPERDQVPSPTKPKSSEGITKIQENSGGDEEPGSTPSRRLDQSWGNKSVSPMGTPLRRLSSASYSGLGMTKSSLNLFFGTAMKKSEMVVRIDLEYLLQEFMAVENYTWALMLAAILLKANVIIGIVEEHPGLWPGFKKALESFQEKSTGYKELLHYLEKHD